VKKQRTTNTGLAKVAVQCSADTFVVNHNLVLRINICAENRHLRQAPNVSHNLVKTHMNQTIYQDGSKNAIRFSEFNKLES
jgi:PhoPQ-activated pathogenicity-related protein